MSNESGVLYVVSTPIGNLEDITLRALRTLKEADLIAAEDTRRTRKLLTHYEIKTRVTSYFEHNEERKSAFLLDLLKQGGKLALVSDAGTPGISDPGYRLINKAIENQITVVPIPGVSSVTAALSVSGLATHSFLFKGFMSPKTARRRRSLETVRHEAATLIFFESPMRLGYTLDDLFEILGDRKIVIAREMTKVFEEVMRGRISDVMERLKGKKIKGEITIMVEGFSGDEEREEKEYLHSFAFQAEP